MTRSADTNPKSTEASFSRFRPNLTALNWARLRPLIHFAF
jgi:hypothetical protein